MSTLMRPYNGVRPSARQTVAIRPLTKGMFTDRAGQAIADGGFVTLKNVIVGPEGIRRRPGFSVIGGDNAINATVTGSPIDSVPVGIITLWQRGAERQDLVITDEFVFMLDYHVGYTLKARLANDVSNWASADALTWTSSGADFQQADDDFDLVNTGDYLVIDSEGGAREITAVNSDESITVGSAYGSSTPYTNEDGHIIRTFQLKDTEYLPDWVYAYGYVYFASRHQRIQQYSYADGMEDFGGGSPVQLDSHYWSAAAIGFWNERLYFGHTEEWDSGTSAMVEYRQRLRFSNALAPTTVTLTDYIDLDYKRGRIVKIIPLGNLLAVYTEDTIYLGRPNNLASSPVTFDEVETGGQGLVGQHAIAPFKDGHFFVGQDNIYFLTTRGLEPIGTPIIRETIEKCNYPWRIIACVDEQRNRVCFGFPETSESISKVWSFNYLTSAWSYEEYSTWMIASSNLDTTKSIDSLSGTIDNLTGTIDELGGTATVLRDFVRERSNKLDVLTAQGSSDPEGAISIVLETKDHDFDQPDTVHKFTRFAMKIEFQDDIAFTSALDFTVQLSHNRGQTWKNVGTLRIKAGEDEGHCDFRLSSSTCRARITSSADVVTYTVTEYTWKVTLGGEDTGLGLQEE